MILTERQTDSLAELINIAFSRTAASLSDLTGDRVLINSPEIAINPIAELPNIIKKLVGGDVATVHQVFKGPMEGDAFLLFDYETGVELASLLSGEKSNGRFNASSREVIIEVGNILLNSCLGMFGNILKMHVAFSVPHLILENVESLLKSLSFQSKNPLYALVAYASFTLQNTELNGYLILVLDATSFDRLVAALEKLG
jgi:chemotaxis protein CheC